MSEFSQNGSSVPVYARMRHLSGSQKFAIFPMEWYPIIPTPTALGVFLALLSHAGNDGWCFPSLETLAGLACVKPRHVRTALRVLETIGAIQTVHASGRSSRYRVMPPPLQMECGQISSSPSNKGRTTLDRTPDSFCPPTPDNFGQEPRTDSVLLSNHVTNHMNKTTATTEKKNDDYDDANDLAAKYAAQKYENDQADALLDAYAAQNDRLGLIATSPEARMLAVCAQWAVGDDVPMPAECVELYRALRHVRRLPARPSTIAKLEPSNRTNNERTSGVQKKAAIAHRAPASADEANDLADAYVAHKRTVADESPVAASIAPSPEGVKANRERFHAMMLEALSHIASTPAPIHSHNRRAAAS